ncbi:hypothetical protein FHW88_005027 [Mucilaginibacter sp. SG538B]|uniref:hypothetical protein n=1 Tax=Mucilaginibacter sp. SG538B TaxID=2587021 RepID=UPI00159E3BB1|nr:hypothetical protein [Mucilaginibacter sp. SG538B]NVM66709.1 hypothetical protein [Mucilaginibacter sp. SG538B]
MKEIIFQGAAFNEKTGRSIGGPSKGGRLRGDDISQINIAGGNQLLISQKLFKFDLIKML